MYLKYMIRLLSWKYYEIGNKDCPSISLAGSLDDLLL